VYKTLQRARAAQNHTDRAEHGLDADMSAPGKAAEKQPMQSEEQIAKQLQATLQQVALQQVALYLEDMQQPVAQQQVMPAAKSLEVSSFLQHYITADADNLASRWEEMQKEISRQWLTMQQKVEKEKKELEDKQRQEQEEKQRQELAEKQRQAQLEEKKRQELAEKQRQAQLEENKRQELAEKQRQAQLEEKKRQELAEKQRQAQLEEKKRQEWAEKQRQAQLEENKRQELAEKQRQAQLEEKKRQELAEKQRQAERARQAMTEQNSIMAVLQTHSEMLQKLVHFNETQTQMLIQQGRTHNEQTKTQIYKALKEMIEPLNRTQETTMKHHELLQEILGEQRKVQVLSQKVETQVSELRKNQLERSQFLESKLSETLKSQFESQSKHNDDQIETQLSLSISMDKLNDKLERQYHKLERQSELNEQHADRLQDIQHAMVPLYTVQEITQQHSATLHEIKQAIDVLMPQKDASESDENAIDQVLLEKECDENLVIDPFDDFEDQEFGQKNKEQLFFKEKELEQYVSERLQPCMGNTLFVADVYRDVLFNTGYVMCYKSFTKHFQMILDQKKIESKEWSFVIKKISQHDMSAFGGNKKHNRATYENLAFIDLDLSSDVFLDLKKKEFIQQYLSANLEPCKGNMLWSRDIYAEMQLNLKTDLHYHAFAVMLKKVVNQKKAENKEWSIVVHHSAVHFQKLGASGSKDSTRAGYENLTFKNRVSDSPTALSTASMEEEAAPLTSQTEPETQKKRKEPEDLDDNLEDSDTNFQEQLQQYLSANLKPCPGSKVFVSDIYTDTQEKNTFGNQSFRAFARLLKQGMKQKIADDEEWSIVLHDPKFYLRGSMDTCRSVYNNLTFKNDRATALEAEASPSSSNTEPQNSKKRKKTEDPEADSEASKSVRI